MSPMDPQLRKRIDEVLNDLFRIIKQGKGKSYDNLRELLAKLIDVLAKEKNIPIEDFLGGLKSILVILQNLYSVAINSNDRNAQTRFAEIYNDLSDIIGELSLHATDDSEIAASFGDDPLASFVVAVDTFLEDRDKLRGQLLTIEEELEKLVVSERDVSELTINWNNTLKLPLAIIANSQELIERCKELQSMVVLRLGSENVNALGLDVKKFEVLRGRLLGSQLQVLLRENSVMVWDYINIVRGGFESGENLGNRLASLRALKGFYLKLRKDLESIAKKNKRLFKAIDSKYDAPYFADLLYKNYTHLVFIEENYIVPLEGVLKAAIRQKL